MPDSEQHLIQRAQKGDSEAFAALVTEHQRYVYNLALRLLNNEEEALDLAQETFVRAFHGMKALRDQSRLSTWLFGIARNVAHEALRANRRNSRQIKIEEAL